MKNIEQIKHLRSGKKNQILNPEVDYSNLPRSTTHVAHAGSNSKQVEEVWEAIKLQHPEYMDIEIMGLNLRLTANWSLSKKTCTYSCEITPEELKNKFLIKPANKKTPYICIHDANTIEASNGINEHTFICPSFIKIK